MKFSYSLTQEAQDRYFVEHGKRVSWPSLEIADTEATPEQRQRYLDLQKVLGSLTVHVGIPYVGQVNAAILTRPVDHELTPENVWKVIDQMFETLPDVQKQATEQRAVETQRREESLRQLNEYKAAIRAQREAETVRNAAERAALVAAASNIQYDDQGKAIVDLLDILFTIVPDEQDTRFNNWAKEVIGQLKLTDITTTNAKPGWALRIRDQIKALLV